MTNSEFTQMLADKLKDVGTERFAAIISNAIDFAGPLNNNHIAYNYKAIISELTEFKKLHITER